MDKFTNIEIAIIVHALFKYAEYLRTFDYPFPTIFRPEGVEKIAFKITNMYKGGAENDK